MFDELFTVPVAHRGVHGPGRPENSLAAFAAACDAGVGIELDVHPVGDEVVAVFHDLTLDRMCGVDAPLASQTRTSLRRLRLAETDQHVPVFEEVLDLVRGSVPLAIELKPPADRAAGVLLCARVAGLLSTYDGPAAVMSFDPWLLRWFAREVPAVTRVQLSASSRVPGVREAARELGIPKWKRLALEHLVVGFFSRPHLIGYDIRALPHPAVSLARRLGRPVLAGIVTTSEELAAAAKHAQGIVFETLDPGDVLQRWRGGATSPR